MAGFHGSSQQLLIASVSHLAQPRFAARVASCYGRARRPLLVAGLASFGQSTPSTIALETATIFIPGRNFWGLVSLGGNCPGCTVSASVPLHSPFFPHSSRSSTLLYSTISRDVEDLKKDPGMENSDWKIKMLYDGECPLCMREVNMLRERNKKYGAIKFVDICADDYSAEENNDIDFETAMGRIHAIRENGEVLTNISAFRALYEEVGLGWVYSITNHEPWASILNKVYDFWAKYRLPISGRPPLVEVLEKRRQRKMEGDKSSADARCRVD